MIAEHNYPLENLIERHCTLCDASKEYKANFDSKEALIDHLKSQGWLDQGTNTSDYVLYDEDFAENPEHGTHLFLCHEDDNSDIAIELSTLTVYPV